MGARKTVGYVREMEATPRDKEKERGRLCPATINGRRPLRRDKTLFCLLYFVIFSMLFHAAT